MKAKAILVCVFAVVLGAAAFAGEQHRMQVEVVVDDDADGTDADVTIITEVDVTN